MNLEIVSLLEDGRLLTFPTYGEGAYSRWELSWGYAFNQINMVVEVFA